MTTFIESGGLILILTRLPRMVFFRLYDATAFVVNVEENIFCETGGNEFQIDVNALAYRSNRKPNGRLNCSGMISVVNRELK